MDVENKFIKRIKGKITTRYEMPEFQIEKISYPDNIIQFTEVSKMVGGNAVLLKEEDDINDFITSLYPEARRIASNLPCINIATTNPDNVNDPHELNNLDLSVIEGEIGVAENGCVWIPQQIRQKVIYFISEYLVIVLDKSKVVSTMHDAYDKIAQQEYGFGVFISGPSKTADIEQALVVGAHGARGVTVILK